MHHAFAHEAELLMPPVGDCRAPGAAITVGAVRALGSRAALSAGAAPQSRGPHRYCSARTNVARRASIALVGGDCGGQPPAGASLMIVVQLASATRRPTVLYAHHDRDGRPASAAGPRWR